MDVSVIRHKICATWKELGLNFKTVLPKATKGVGSFVLYLCIVPLTETDSVSKKSSILKEKGVENCPKFYAY